MPLVKIAVIFILVLGASRYFKLKLWPCLIVGGSLMGMVFGMAPAGIFKTFVRTTSDAKTIEILFILYSIAVLEYTLRITGMLNKLIINLKKVFRDDRLVLGLLPAFLGFLPSPGGALFSAPLVDEASKNLEISNEKKSFINFWFRHVWETVFPLFPGLILAAAMSKLPLYDLIFHMAPASLVCIAAGCLIVFTKKLQKKHDAAIDIIIKVNAAVIIDLVLNLLPILIIIFGALFLKINILALIATAIVWTFIQTGTKFREIKKIFADTLYSQNLMLIVAIMMFAGILEDSGASKAIPETFAEMNIPVYFIFIAMPLSLGILTGINTAFVGLSFPILAGLAGGLNVNNVSLAYLSGMAGVMLSPLHLCLILTLNYFKADPVKFYKLMLFPASILIILAMLLGGL